MVAIMDTMSHVELLCHVRTSGRHYLTAVMGDRTAYRECIQCRAKLPASYGPPGNWFTDP